jgi:hypothetical protein
MGPSGVPSVGKQRKEGIFWANCPKKIDAYQSHERAMD